MCSGTRSMKSAPRPEPRRPPQGVRPRPQSRRPLLRRIGLAVLALAIVSSPLPASHARAAEDERWLMQGLADFAWFDTDEGSRLLSVDGGDGTGSGALRLWAAGELAPGFHAFVMGAYANRPPVEGEERDPDTDLEQGYLRYTAPGKARLMIEAGRMVTPVGDFSPRYLPDQNPLVGTPSDYSVAYPEGIKVVGWVNRFDMMAAAVNRPLNADWYALPSGKAMRPMLSAGYTPATGLRFGLFTT